MLHNSKRLNQETYNKKKKIGLNYWHDLIQTSTNDYKNLIQEEKKLMKICISL